MAFSSSSSNLSLRTDGEEIVIDCKTLTKQVCEDTKSFADIADIHRAFSVMGRLLDEHDKSPEQVLRYIQRSPHAERLFAELFEALKEKTPQQHENFARTLFEALFRFRKGGGENPEVGFSAKTVADLVIPTLDAGQLLKKFQGTLCSPTHPLFPLIDPDVFWKARIANLLKQRKLTAAYYQITQANGGLGIPVKFDGEDVTYPAHGYVHRATIRAQRDIVRSARFFFAKECQSEVDMKPVSAEYAKGKFTIVAVVRIPAIVRGQAVTWLDVKSQVPCMQEALNLDYGETPIEDLPIGLVGLSLSEEAQMLLSMAEYFERDRRALSGKSRV